MKGQHAHANTRAGGAFVSVSLPAQKERHFFEYDRKTVLSQMDSITRESRDSAEQLEMIAAERIFDQSTSGEFTRVATTFSGLLRELSAVRVLVSRARSYPS
jgi:hypothetical protein